MNQGYLQSLPSRLWGNSSCMEFWDWSSRCAYMQSGLCKSFADVRRSKYGSSIVEKFESMEYGPALEDAGEVTRWLEAHGRRFGSYIDGAWTVAGAGETFAVKNPATGELLATVESAGAAEVDRAVTAARAALPEWQALPGHWRARYLVCAGAAGAEACAAAGGARDAG